MNVSVDHKNYKIQLNGKKYSIIFNGEEVTKVNSISEAVKFIEKDARLKKALKK